ncbi:MAG TPA: lysylphosphatidylglycerol synthase transmembrane domain-containing protein [Anaerolineaceae bacterium]|nr:lysylphosphatidylglycerol synthase transmembrane domain-containing protein [Anaerolineaceae bacterium]HPN50195.1 lysylphosphatidylglycerol synthase transmembrane domain-containing protein [Anaerolineaceae bacterium]
MVPNKSAPRWQWLPGVIISLAALFFVFRSINLEDFARAFSMIGVPVLLAACALWFLGIFARALCWHLLLGKPVPYLRTFFIMNIGYLLNNIFPLRLGEFGRAAVMGKASQKGFFHALSAIVVERAFDLAIAAGLLLFSLTFIASEQYRPLAWGILGAVVIGVVGLYLMTCWRSRIDRLTAWFSSRWPKIGHWVQPKVASVLDGFATMTNPGLFIICFLLMFVSWLLAVALDYLLLIQVVPQVPFWWPVFLLAVTALGAALPSAPASLGTYEGAVWGALAILGVDSSTAIALAIIMHAINFSLSSLSGLVGLTREGERLTTLYQRLLKEKPE